MWLHWVTSDLTKMTNSNNINNIESNSTRTNSILHAITLCPYRQHTATDKHSYSVQQIVYSDDDKTKNELNQIQIISKTKHERE